MITDAMRDRIEPLMPADPVRGRRWAVDGTWERVVARVLAAADADDDIGWTVSVTASTGSSS
ncbi:hypothetical protein [Streptomyces vietnamensis]|uniref:hypothetical protein n=1 Tax=Streptomyces vietnamensis TaxID=362257 RepID=UPI003CCB9162